MAGKPNLMEHVRHKFQAIVDGKQSVDEKANDLIWAAVTINAGLGAVPLGINVWTFIGVSSALTVFLGRLYGHHLTHESAAKVIKQIFMSVGTSFFMYTMGLKFFFEVLKGAGVITVGGATAVGMALDATLCGAVTYALGFTTKETFKSNRPLSKEETRAKFMAAFEEAKDRLKK